MNDAELASLAKRFREEANKTRAQAAREMGVKQTSIFNAEETPKASFFKLRSRLIEAYSTYKVVSRITLVKKSRTKKER